MNFFLRKFKMVPLSFVDKLLEMKDSSLEEIRGILQKKTDELKGKAEKLRNSSEEIRQNALEEFEEAAAKLRNELKRSLTEADAQKLRASKANSKAIEFREMLEVIS